MVNLKDCSLRAQGLVDLDDPRSRILTFKMGEKDLERARGSFMRRRVRPSTRPSLRDPVLHELPDPDTAERAKPKRSDAVIRHARHGA